MRSFLAFLLLSLFLASQTHAADESGVPLKKITPSEFPDLQKYLVDEMRPGQRFGYVKTYERDAVSRDLAAMAELLHGRQSLEDLSEDERVALINAQGRINGTLTRRDRDRLVCEKVTPLGSHRSQTYCETYGQRMSKQYGDRKQWDDMQMETLSCKETGFQNSTMVCSGG